MWHYWCLVLFCVLWITVGGGAAVGKRLSRVGSRAGGVGSGSVGVCGR
jgi:hypothetical protein